MATFSQRLDRFQRRHRWIGLGLAVVYKYADDQGNYLAALLTYYGFLSLFPLLLLGVTVLGFVLHGDPHLQQQVIHSAVSDFPVIGKQLQTGVRSYSGSGVALTVSILASIYGGLGVAQAGQNAMNIVWGVPRNARPNPLKARLRSLLILGFLGLGVLATTGLSALSSGAQSFARSLHMAPGGRWLALVLSVALNILLFVIGFRILTVKRVTTRDVVSGAVIAAVAWQVLQTVGTYYVAHKLKGSQDIYGVFAVVLGLIAWIYVESVVIVLCAEFNVVVRNRLWPRSLMTPFTDKVALTPADRRAYQSYAHSQRFKGFQRIDVQFAQPHQVQSPERPPGGGRRDGEPEEDAELAERPRVHDTSTS